MTALTPVGGPHTHANGGVSGVMGWVVLALLPATGMGIYLFGWPALNLLLVTVLSALLAEAFSLWIAGKRLRPYLLDGSAVLTGLLLALTLPPWAPWWIGALGSAFAIVVGKQVFGGVGQNIFNPAMLARVALLISFPLEMTTFIDPLPLFSSEAVSFSQGLAITFLGASGMSQAGVDIVSAASPMGHIKTGFTQGLGLSQTLTEQFSPSLAAIGFMNGSLGETSAVLLLLGGLILLAKRIITWHIPVAMLGTVLVLSGLFHLINPERYADPVFHLLTGGMMLGAFFIATDMVTSPSTPRGQLVFGAGCGVLIYIIRTWGGYPEGIGFAVLLMNALTPLIDHYVRPRIYGRTRKGAPIEYAQQENARRAGKEGGP